MDPRQRLHDLAVSDSGFVFDPYTGSTFSANPTGLTLLRGIVAGLGREELMERLKEEFEVGEEDLHRDVAEFVQVLREQGLLPADFQLE